MDINCKLVIDLIVTVQNQRQLLILNILIRIYNKKYMKE